MKPTFLTRANLVLAGALFVSKVTGEVPSPKNQSIVAELRKAPVSELGTVAVARINRAKVSARETITREVVRSVVALRPTGALMVLATIARQHPDMAAAAASAVVEKRRDLIPTATQLAIERASNNVNAIVTALTRQAPVHYKDIAIAAKKAAPGADREILAGLEIGAPALKPAIDLAMSSLATARQPVTVPAVLAQVEQMVDAAAKSLKVKKAMLVTLNDGRLAQALPTSPPTIGEPYNTPTGLLMEEYAAGGNPMVGPRTYSRP